MLFLEDGFLETGIAKKIKQDITPQLFVAQPYLFAPLADRENSWTFCGLVFEPIFQAVVIGAEGKYGGKFHYCGQSGTSG